MTIKIEKHLTIFLMLTTVFISANSLLNDLMEIFVDLGMFTYVIFKDRVRLLLEKKRYFSSKRIFIWFKCKFKKCLDFTSKILPSVNIIYKKMLFSKKGAFLYNKNVG